MRLKDKETKRQRDQKTKMPKNKYTTKRQRYEKTKRPKDKETKRQRDLLYSCASTKLCLKPKSTPNSKKIARASRYF